MGNGMALPPPFGGTHRCPPTGGLIGSMEGWTGVSALASACPCKTLTPTLSGTSS